MALDAVKNFGKVRVSTGYNDTATTIVLTTGHGARLPAPATDGQFNLVWWNVTDHPDPVDDSNKEIVRVTARTADTLTVTRAQEGTTASTKNTSGKAYNMILGVTAKTITDIAAEVSTHAVLTNAHGGTKIKKAHLITANTVQYKDNLGTDIIHAHDAEVSSATDDDWVKVKTITLTETPDTSLKIYFELKSSGGDFVYGKIYRNGVAVGTEQLTDSITYVPFTETISGWSNGNTLELWILSSPWKTVYAQNFRILGTVGNNNLVNS
jgi:hypothetical protein